MKCNTYPKEFLKQKDKAKINIYKANTHVITTRLRDRALGEFPGSPMVRTRRFHCRGPGSIPGQGTEILQAARRSKKKRKEKENRNRALISIVYASYWILPYDTFGIYYLTFSAHISRLPS